MNVARFETRSKSLAAKTYFYLPQCSILPSPRNFGRFLTLFVLSLSANIFHRNKDKQKREVEILKESFV